MSTEDTPAEAQPAPTAISDLETATWAVATLGATPDDLHALVSDTRTAGKRRLALMADALRRRREGKVAEHGRPTSSADVVMEVTAFADAGDAFAAVARMFTELAADAHGYAAQAAEEASVNGRPVRVGDAHGTDVKVSWEQRTKPSVDLDRLLPVLVDDAARLLPTRDGETAEGLAQRGADYRSAVREGMDTVLRLGRMDWSTAKLEALARTMEAEATDDAARRSLALTHSYGRVDVGEPKPKVTREAPKGAPTKES